MQFELPKGVTLSANGETATLTLRRPVMNGETSISALILREPLVADLLSAGDAKNETERGAMLLAAVAGVPFAVVRKLYVDDYVAAQEAIDCLGKARSQETGETS